LSVTRRWLGYMHPAYMGSGGGLIIGRTFGAIQGTGEKGAT
jgi:hypothetical protein